MEININCTNDDHDDDNNNNSNSNVETHLSPKIRTVERWLFGRMLFPMPTRAVLILNEIMFRVWCFALKPVTSRCFTKAIVCVNVLCTFTHWYPRNDAYFIDVYGSTVVSHHVSAPTFPIVFWPAGQSAKWILRRVPCFNCNRISARASQRQRRVGKREAESGKTLFENVMPYERCLVNVSDTFGSLMFDMNAITGRSSSIHCTICSCSEHNSFLRFIFCVLYDCYRPFFILAIAQCNKPRRPSLMIVQHEVVSGFLEATAT